MSEGRETDCQTEPPIDLAFDPIRLAEVKDRIKNQGAGILTAVEKFVSRFVCYPSEHARVAHILWLAHTHLMDAWDSTPRIAFLSPEPSSGKSRALEVSELLVPRPVEAINVTPAYLFRKVGDEEGRPTILFDEVDTVFGPKARDNEEVRGLLNAGHRKHAVAGRCVVRGKQVFCEELPAYSAVALAGLGDLPDTILSRAVVVRMKRRSRSESIEPYRRRCVRPEGAALCQRLVSWAGQVAPLITQKWPEMPAGVEDRDADVWEALVAVADMAGGGWPDRARSAALYLVKESRQSSPSLGIQLLFDLRVIFQGHENLHRDTVLRELVKRDDSPWGNLDGKPIDSYKLSRFLRKYQIKQEPVKQNGMTARGYRRIDFIESWDRYLPQSPSPESVTSVTSVTNSLEASKSAGSSVTLSNHQSVTKALPKNVAEDPESVTTLPKRYPATPSEPSNSAACDCAVTEVTEVTLSRGGVEASEKGADAGADSFLSEDALNSEDATNSHVTNSGHLRGQMASSALDLQIIDCLRRLPKPTPADIVRSIWPGNGALVHIKEVKAGLARLENIGLVKSNGRGWGLL